MRQIVAEIKRGTLPGIPVVADFLQFLLHERVLVTEKNSLEQKALRSAFQIE